MGSLLILFELSRTQCATAKAEPAISAADLAGSAVDYASLRLPLSLFRFSASPAAQTGSGGASQMLSSAACPAPSAKNNHSSSPSLDPHAGVQTELHEVLHSGTV